MARKQSTEDVFEQIETTEPEATEEVEPGTDDALHPADQLAESLPYDADWRRIAAELAKPFEPWQIRVKPGKVGSNGQALALWYIDARAVMDRLDKVVGPENWQFDWRPIPGADGRVVVQGMLTVRGVTKSDVGEARGEDEPWKSGVSDSFKRTAVQFGIGRFLYRLPQLWWPYDEQGRRFQQVDELQERVRRVMDDLIEVDGDVSRIDVRDYQPSGRGPERQTSSESRGELTPAQEGYIRRLYTQRFGRFSNGNVLFANFLRQSINRVCPIEKLTRAEADVVIKGLQELASAA